MKRFNLSLVLFLFLPTLVCQAETVELSPIIVTKRAPVQIPYAFSKLTVSQGPVQEVKLDHPLLPPAEEAFALVKTAEAYAQPTELVFRNFEIICNRINEARRLKDLEPFISTKNYEAMKASAEKGTSEGVIVTMLQSTRPQNIRVVDASIIGNRADLAVTGQSTFGPMNGLLRLNNGDGVWRVEEEQWYAGYNNYTVAHNPQALAVYKDPLKPKSLIAKYSPDYMLNTKFLALTKAPYSRDKESFTVLFVLNKGKHPPKRSELTKFREENGLIRKPRAYVHLLWTGSKKILRNQHMIRDKYPMDVSIAPADDGLAAGEWNVILPKKRPQSFRIGMLWAF